MTPVVFTVSETGEPVPNKGIVFFTFQVISLLGIGIYSLAKKLRHSTGHEKSQLRLMALGLAITFGLIFISNFFLVVVFSVTNLLALGPAYTLIFSSTVAYAIVKHRLFDIRAAIARSVGFVLSLGFIGLAYAVVTYSILSVIGTRAISESTERALYIGLALATAFVYPYIKLFFERVTTRLFFKDAYDTQIFLNQLNEVLVGKVVLEPLLTASAKIISDNMKSSRTTFVIRKTAYFPVRVLGDKLAVDSENLQFLNEHTKNLPEKIVVTELLEEGNKSLQRYLNSKDINVLIRLIPNLDYLIEGVGYLALGPKRNGELYSKKDLEVLEIIANELVIAIENGLRFEEIDAFNSTLQDKIDTATLQLKRTNDKLKALDETKDEFISMASHQLRTPLTSVKGYVSMVLEGDAGELNATQRKLLEQSFASSQRMVYLIADLLNLSRLRTGKFIIEAKPTNLAEVIESEVDQLKASASGRNLTLTYEKPDNFPSLMIDETKIRQVIMNFADNAIYYTPAGGKIDIKLKDSKDSVEFTVNDNGIGIPTDEQHHLFNKFYRAKNAQKARPDGTGLGLFMAKKVIIAQGGAIVFKSKEGKGSTFGFAFSKHKLKVPKHLEHAATKA
jgi:signal transduction histidine kinase